jgi:hypothetical protein
MRLLTKHISRVVGLGALLGVGSLANNSYALTEEFYSWNQSQGTVTVMMPASEGMCFLTGIGGHFQGTGENVHLEIDNGVWVMTGASQQTNVNSTATCVAWSDLGGDGGYGYEEFWANASGPVSHGIFACGTCEPQQNDATMWNNYNFCSLSYVSGNLDSNSWIEQVWNGSTWVLNNWENGEGSDMLDAAFCYGLKLPHTMTISNQYNWTVGDQPVAMMPASEAVCALTQVDGGFRGSGENVYIENLGGTLYLWGESWQANTTVGARCVPLNQH